LEQDLKWKFTVFKLKNGCASSNNLGPVYAKSEKAIKHGAQPYNNRFDRNWRGRHALCSVGRCVWSYGKGHAGSPTLAYLPVRELRATPIRSIVRYTDGINRGFDVQE
jgi:hypothetical protein